MSNRFELRKLVKIWCCYCEPQRPMSAEKNIVESANRKFKSCFLCVIFVSKVHCCSKIVVTKLDCTGLTLRQGAPFHFFGGFSTSDRGLGDRLNSTEDGLCCRL